MSDKGANKGADADAGRWMTYAQLAELRGISKKAAQRLTLRHQWRRQPANDGGVLILVPDAAASSGRQTGRRDGGSDRPDIAALLDDANKRADAALAVADQTLAQLAMVSARADRLERDLAAALIAADAARTDAQGARQEAEVLRKRMEALAAEREAAVAQAEAARGRAEAAARLAEAAREKAAQAEAAFTGEHDARVAAEARATADHDRAEAARQRADEAEEYSTRLVGELNEFRVKAEAAEAEAATLRTQWIARKARGRWARLRAAWRAE